MRNNNCLLAKLLKYTLGIASRRSSTQSELSERLKKLEYNIHAISDVATACVGSCLTNLIFISTSLFRLDQVELSDELKTVVHCASLQASKCSELLSQYHKSSVLGQMRMKSTLLTYGDTLSAHGHQLTDALRDYLIEKDICPSPSTIASIPYVSGCADFSFISS